MNMSVKYFSLVVPVLILLCDIKVKVVSYSITSTGLGADPGLLAVSPQVVYS